ncbi:MAG TPA: DUF2934 domain-containing protein [Bryobacteraceae bacterium]|nr:DUF2934 domain-containing protein [Bryobacteraceae bacterium]
MRSHTGKRSRPKAEIEPIRVSELLTGAGMRGFLSVLEPPVAVPHLRQLAVRTPVFASPEELAEWLSARAEALLRRMGGQQEDLAAIAEIARRTNDGAERLQRVTERIRLGTIHHAALSAACHWKGESFMKKAAVTRAHRTSATEAGWQEWISEAVAARTANEATAAPHDGDMTADLRALHEAIARLAYEHWQERGCPSGSPEVDWFHAEKKLVQQQNAS